MGFIFSPHFRKQESGWDSFSPPPHFSKTRVRMRLTHLLFFRKQNTGWDSFRPPLTLGWTHFSKAGLRMGLTPHLFFRKQDTKWASILLHFLKARYGVGLIPAPFILRKRVAGWGSFSPRFAKARGRVA